MSAFKRLNKGDIFTTPYVANKDYNILATDTNNYISEVGINNFNLNSNNYLIYRSILQNFYPITYYNYFQLGYDNRLNTINYQNLSTSSGQGYIDIGNQYTIKNFPTSSNATIYITNFSNLTTGEKILENSLNIPISSSIVGLDNIIDDGNFNLILSSSNIYIGNIFYQNNTLIITNQTYINNLYTINSFSFTNYYTIYEKFIKCTFKDYEFNYTYNPTVSNISGSIYPQFTGSYFSPYITTLGLYNDSNDLLACVKFAAPIISSNSTDTTILVKIDT